MRKKDILLNNKLLSFSSIPEKQIKNSQSLKDENVNFHPALEEGSSSNISNATLINNASVCRNAGSLSDNNNTGSRIMYEMTIFFQVKFFLFLFIALFNISNLYSFSISNLPDLEEPITKDKKIINQKYYSNDYIQNSNPNDSLVLHDNKIKNYKISVESNTLITSENDIKLNDKSDLDDIENRNKLADLINKKKDNDQFIKNEGDASPMLHFVISKVRPFIEVRIDSMLTKAGFESYLREKTDLISQLKINNLSESDVKNVQKAVCGNGAEISFTVADEYGNVIDREYDNKKLWVNIGQNALPRGLELGMIGMKINEIREITSPPNLNTGPTPLSKKLFLLNTKSVFKVAVHDIKDNEALDEIKNNLRFYDVSSSISRTIECMDIISLDIRVLNASGDILYKKPKDKKVYLIVGSGTAPYIEQIILNARNDGKRIAFVKTKFLEDLKKNPYLLGLEKVLNENESVILELSPHIE